MNEKPPRKLSWQYHDLSWMIQTGPREISAKLVLLFLSAKADDSGRSWHGYSSIKRHTGIRKDESVSVALKYWKAAGLLKWVEGKGGGRAGTNHYSLNLQAMRRLVTKQGLFDVETGKALSRKVNRIDPKLSPLSGAAPVIKIGRSSQKLSPLNGVASAKATPSQRSVTPNTSKHKPSHSFSSIERKHVQHVNVLTESAQNTQPVAPSKSADSIACKTLDSMRERNRMAIRLSPEFRAYKEAIEARDGWKIELAALEAKGQDDEDVDTARKNIERWDKKARTIAAACGKNLEAAL